MDNGCPLTMYSFYYKQIQPRVTGAQWDSINITDILETHYFLSLKCDTQYMIEVSAWNELGQSNRSKAWVIKTSSGRLLWTESSAIRPGERKKTVTSY